jgi:hypothetical protein
LFTNETYLTAFETEGVYVEHYMGLVEPIMVKSHLGLSHGLSFEVQDKKDCNYAATHASLVHSFLLGVILLSAFSFFSLGFAQEW